MNDGSGSGGAADDVRRLEQTLAAIGAQLAQVAEQVAKLSAAGGHGRGGGLVGDAAPAGVTPASDAAAAAPPSPAPGMTPPSASPVSAAEFPAPPPAYMPAGAFVTSWPSGPAGTTPQSSTVGPGRPPAAAEPHRSWADTSGLKVLGWVGGGVTVLGIVMLLVVAIQQGLLSPLARVCVGAVIGLLLIGGGSLLRRRENQTALAVTLACTGLAALYLTTIGAVRLADLMPPVVGHGASAVIVVIGVCLALAWREPWLAGLSFAASALLAPVVGGEIDAGVYVFEALLVAGGAACLLLQVGLVAWTCASAAAGLVVFAGMTLDDVRPGALLAILAMVLLTWVLFLGRWSAGRAPRDPGPFPLRPRSTDPAQIARDYADFHAHTARVAAARADAVAATISLAVSAALLVMALAVARPVGVHEVGIGLIAAILAMLFAGLAWASGHVPALSRISLRVTAWSAAIACAAVALLRLLSGDARSISWLVLGIIVLAAVGVERLMFLLVPAVAIAAFAVLAAWPALSPSALFRWPSEGLLDTSGLLPRGWTVVLPAGICVIVLCAAGWWAVSRCSAARLAEVRSTLRADATAGLSHGYPQDEAAAAQSRHTTITGWALVICSAVACYGLIAVTMVLTYSISPTHAGYQAGQIVVTIFVTLVALVLLWQGFRRVVLRLGGLGIAAVAVAKLLLFDTRTLEALPRAMTTIGVGVLLLLAAVAYVVTLSRLNAVAGPVAEDSATLAAAPAPGAPGDTSELPGTLGSATAGAMWAAPPREERSVRGS